MQFNVHGDECVDGWTGTVFGQNDNEVLSSFAPNSGRHVVEESYLSSSSRYDLDWIYENVRIPRVISRFPCASHGTIEPQ